jgi:hypothetical protein
MGQRFEVYFSLRRSAEASPRLKDSSYRECDRALERINQMQTLYVALAFLMMIALPFFISKREMAEADQRQPIEASKSRRRS